MGNKWTWAALLGLAAFAAVRLHGCVVDARAHRATPTAAMPGGFVYDGWCCNGSGVSGDCQEIHYSRVKTIEGGYQITLVAGDHRKVTRLHVFQIEQAKVRASPDGQYHVCLFPTEDILRCFYAPPPNG